MATVGIVQSTLTHQRDLVPLVEVPDVRPWTTVRWLRRAVYERRIPYHRSVAEGSSTCMTSTTSPSVAELSRILAVRLRESTRRAAAPARDRGGRVECSGEAGTTTTTRRSTTCPQWCGGREGCTWQCPSRPAAMREHEPTVDKYDDRPGRLDREIGRVIGKVWTAQPAAPTATPCTLDEAHLVARR